MRVALLADVHANLPAFEAVLRSARRYAPDATICLGDVVGYNADPRGCIALLRDGGCRVVAGNHDRDMAGRVTPSANLPARIAQDWTRDQLGPAEHAYLTQLPNILVEPERYVAVHGCYLNPAFFTGYVTSTMLEQNLEAIARRGEWPSVGFCGHTHVPMCGWRASGTVVELGAGTSSIEYPAGADAVLVNPGSVGQPRDGDPRAAFAVIDLDRRRVQLCRVEYDVARAVAAIAAAGLPMELGERLTQGR